MLTSSLRPLAIDSGAKPEKREKNLRKAAKTLLKNYPPPPKK